MERKIIYSILATVAPPQFIELWLRIFGLDESSLPEVPETDDFVGSTVWWGEPVFRHARLLDQVAVPGLEIL